LLAATLAAELVIVSRRGQRSVRPNEYFVTALMTTLEPDELLTEIRLRLLDYSWRTGFAEFSRGAGDFALAMCAAFLRFEDHGSRSHPPASSRRSRTPSSSVRRCARAQPDEPAPTMM
jgi:CO/xanthine dehydrogenase FAD-binding subunit